jgi:hypothetical protein
VTEIGWGAFSGCSALTTVTSLNPNPPSIDYDTFIYYSANLQVPRGSKNAYAAADFWSNFTNITEIETTTLGDVNNDMAVDVADVVAIVNYILGEPDNGFNEAVADVNGDGKIDVDDVVQTVNIILGE